MSSNLKKISFFVGLLYHYPIARKTAATQKPIFPIFLAFQPYRSYIFDPREFIISTFLGIPTLDSEKSFI